MGILGGNGIEEKNLIFIGLIAFFTLYYVGAKYYPSELKDVKQPKIDKLFESNVFNEAQKKYGINGMGVGKSEKILSIRMNDIKNKKEVQKYFEKQLLNIGVKNYKVEVLEN